MNHLDKDLLSKFEQSRLSSSEQKLFKKRYREDKEFRSIAEGLGIQMAVVRIMGSRVKRSPPKFRFNKWLIALAIIVTIIISSFFFLPEIN